MLTRKLFIAFPMLFLLTISKAQTVEIHQMAAGNADAGMILIRDTVAVMNIFRYEVAREELSKTEYLSFRAQLNTVSYPTFGHDTADHLFQYQLSMATLTDSEKNTLNTKLTTGGFNFNDPNVTQLEDTLTNLADLDDPYQEALDRLNRYQTSMNGLFSNNQDRTNMVQKILFRQDTATNFSDYSLLGTVKKTVMIDAGRMGSAARGIGEYVLDQGVQKVNMFALSHYHDDHYGGYKSIYEKGGTFAVDSVRESGYQYIKPSLAKKSRFSTTYRSPMKAANNVANFGFDSNPRREAIEPGYIYTILPGVRLVCVTSNSFVYGDDPDNDPVRGGTSPNDYSLGWILQYRTFKYLSAGDLSGYGPHVLNGDNVCQGYKDVETALCQSLKDAPGMGNSGHVSAFKISHHGSRCSSNPAFLDTLSATVGIIPNGRDKHRNPDKETYERLDTMKNTPIFYQMEIMMKAGTKKYTAYETAKGLMDNNRLYPTGNTVIVVDDITPGPAARFVVRWDGETYLSKTSLKAMVPNIDPGCHYYTDDFGLAEEVEVHSAPLETDSK